MEFFFRHDYLKTPFTIYNYREFKREDEIKRLLSRLIKSATFNGKWTVYFQYKN